MYPSISHADPRTHIIGGPDMFVDVGSMVNLSCVVAFTERPPEKVIWFHNGIEISYRGPRTGVSVSERDNFDSLKSPLPFLAPSLESRLIARESYASFQKGGIFLLLLGKPSVGVPSHQLTPHPLSTFRCSFGRALRRVFRKSGFLIIDLDDHAWGKAKTVEAYIVIPNNLPVHSKQREMLTIREYS